MTIVTDEMVEKARNRYKMLLSPMAAREIIEAIAPDLLAQGVRMGLAQTKQEISRSYLSEVLDDRQSGFNHGLLAASTAIGLLDPNQIVKDAI